MRSSKPTNAGVVQAIERGRRILDLLGRGKQSYSIHDLSCELNLPKPTVHRILSTLNHFGYAVQEEGPKEYRLGFLLVKLGQAVFDQIDLRKEADPFLSGLPRQVRETVHLVTLDQGEIVYLDKVEEATPDTPF